MKKISTLNIKFFCFICLCFSIKTFLVSKNFSIKTILVYNKLILVFALYTMLNYKNITK